MKEIIEKHRQDFDEIRKFCLTCHGLDLTTSSLSSKNSRLNVSGKTEVILQNMISSNLLSLAIALRINLYQKIIPQYDKIFPDSAWLYFDDELIERPATLKQVCDKIVHADSISKAIIPHEFAEDSKIAIQFKGV